MVKYKLIVALEEGELESLKENLPFNEGIEIVEMEDRAELTISHKKQDVEIIESTLKDNNFDIIDLFELNDNEPKGVEATINRHVEQLFDEDDDEKEDAPQQTGEAQQDGEAVAPKEDG